MFGAAVLLVVPAPASAQTNLQLWGNLTLDWVKSDRLVYELDVEPKVLLDAAEGAPGWRNLDVTDVDVACAADSSARTSPAAAHRRPRPGARGITELRLFRQRQRIGVVVADPQPARVPRPAEQRADQRRRRALSAGGLGVVRPARRSGRATGLGYRRSFHWRFEALYIWTRSRNTIADDFTTSDNIIDIRVKRLF